MLFLITLEFKHKNIQFSLLRTVNVDGYKKKFPLWQIARNKEMIKKAHIPSKKIFIRDTEILNVETISVDEIRSTIVNNISKLEKNTNFLKDDIIYQMNDILHKFLGFKMLCYTIKSTVSSGTYIRGIVNTISKRINLPMFTYAINRTKLLK